MKKVNLGGLPLFIGITGSVGQRGSCANIIVAFSVIMLVLSAPSILRIVLIGDYTVLHDVVLIAFIVPTSIILLSDSLFESH